MKKSIWLILILMLIPAAFPLATQAAPLKKLSWRAEYYDNPSLSGHPKISIIESEINHDWGRGSPAPELPADHFSVRWTDERHFEQGTYLFILNVDDGARVWVDGQLLLDAWNIGHQNERRARLYFEQGGDHEIQVAYFENTGWASINFRWIQLGGEGDVVGAWWGEYFDNRDLAGEPVLRRQDGAINFDWNGGSPSPKVTRDNFSVRWTRSIYLDRTGNYTFKIQHDDGMRVRVDGRIIYESWFDQAVTYQVRNIHLEAGQRSFVVEYYDHVGNATARLTIDQDPGAYEGYDPGPEGAGVIIDNMSGHFQWGGSVSDRYSHGGGYKNHCYWTYNTNTSPVNYGQWTLPVSKPGNYELFAYIPADRATATQARYRIFHADQRTDRVINQNIYYNEFVSLGTYYFDAGGNEKVLLYDNTGEADGNTQVAFDALKFVQR